MKGCNDDDDGWAEDCGFGMFQPRAAARRAERGQFLIKSKLVPQIEMDDDVVP